MNEAIFFAQLLFALGFLAIAVRLGKEALLSYIALSGVLANLFVVKQTILFGLSVTCSDIFAVGGILGLNLLQELHGKAIAKKATHASLLCLLVFAAMGQIHLLYAPSALDATHGAFALILSSSPRIVAASIGVYYLVQRIDLVVFAALPLRRLSSRLLCSLLISQAIDTALFSFFGLYGLVASLVDILLISYVIKCAIIACSSPLAALFRRFSPREAT